MCLSVNVITFLELGLLSGVMKGIVIGERCGDSRSFVWTL